MDDARAGGLPDWLTQFDVRAVSLAPPHRGGGTEVRFWTDRPLSDVVAHFTERSGEPGEVVEPDRRVWNSDRVDGRLRRLRTMVVESAPGPGAPVPPPEAITVVWVSDLAVPFDDAVEREADPGPSARRWLRWLRWLRWRRS